MPKKAATARNRAQRNKPKVQKTFELVRPERVETEADEESSSTSVKASTAVADQEVSKASVSASTAVSAKDESKASTAEGQASPLRETGGRGQPRPVRGTGGREQAPPLREEAETETEEPKNTPALGSASARLAARRQAAQKLQQRSAATLITSEHFAYVRKDLIRIAVFAMLMFAAIIVLYFTLGRA